MLFNVFKTVAVKRCDHELYNALAYNLLLIMSGIPHSNILTSMQYERAIGY